MTSKQLLTLLLVIVNTVDSSPGNKVIYTAIAPTQLEPFSTFSIVTTLEKATAPLKFQFTISFGENETTLVTKFETLNPQEQKVVTLDILGLSQHQYNLSVKIFPTEGQEPSEERTILNSQFRNTTILIQTDKPIYKPSETVRFRVLVLNRDFRPFQSPRLVDISIRDPQSNIIKSWKQAEINRGYLSEAFELSSEPNLGHWSVHVTLDEARYAQQSEATPLVRNSSSQKTSPGPQHPVNTETNVLMESFPFTVDEYILPKFKVTLKLNPTFVTLASSKVAAEVEATYTFGKPVTGKCTLVLKDPNLYFRPYGSSEDKKQVTEVSKGINLEGGRAILEFYVRKELLDIHPEEIDGKKYRIDASCYDAVSGMVQSESESFWMYKLPYKVKLIEGSREDLKPGLPYTVKVKVTYQDGRPIEDSDPKALKIHHGFTLSVEHSVVYKTLNQFGEASHTFQVPTNPHLSYNEGLQVTYKDLRQTLHLGRKIVSSTGSYLQLSKPRPTPVEGEQVTLDIYASKPYSRLNLLVVAKGNVVHRDYLQFQEPLCLNRTLSLKLPKGSSPRVKVIVYTIAPETNDVVADLLEFNVEQSETVGVQLHFSGESAEPGTNVTLTVKGLPNSIFGLRAVDTSVLLQQRDNDLSQEKLSNAASKFNPTNNNRRGDYVFQQMSRAGLALLTNAVVERPWWTHDGSFAYYLPPRDDTQGYGYGWGSYSAPTDAPRVRSNFLETWIWEEIDSPGGEASIVKTVPDTITSWSVSAFQLNAEEGLGLTAAPSKLEVFRPFFIFVNLPYSIVKGEVLGIQVILYNYLETFVQAQVTLENYNGFFKFLEDEAATKLSKSVNLNASSVTSVTFPISAVKFGTMNLRVSAVSNAASDAVSVPLIVKPPGVKHTQNNAVLVNLLEAKSLNQQVSPVFPHTRVPGADFLKVSVIGDILGGTMNNLNRLIRLPSGCGEQNMLHFVPNIVILDYLTATGGLTPAIQEKTLRYLNRGYQRQLTFLRYDGSFSTFGKSDRAGSTWLTAFVTRWFIQAQKYIPIDHSVISRSLEFLVAQQTDKGRFAEEGRVYDKSLQGGSGQNKYALTAFVLLTFNAALKANVDLATGGTETLSQVISNGTSFILKGTSKGQLKNPYHNSLISYLLTELNHSQAAPYFSFTEDAAKIDLKTGLKHWDAHALRSRQPAEEDLSTLPGILGQWEQSTKPSSVETTAYALLTSIRRGQLSDSFAVARWLIRQRSAEGGFISTQDTVVGISALAEFAQAVQTHKNAQAEMTVDVVTSQDVSTSPAHSFHIGKDNLTTLQEYILPLNVTQVELKASGNGTALAQLTWSYYIEAKDASPAFNLNVDVKEKEKGRVIDLRICTTVIRGGESNMAILEATTPSGYVFDHEDLETLRTEKVFRRYETDDKDSKVNLYFDSITQQLTCVLLRAYRIYLVAQHSNASVVVYDYYDTTRRGQVFYSVNSMFPCDICVNDNTCKLMSCA